MQMNTFDRATKFQEALIGNQPTSFMKRVNRVIYRTSMRAQQDVLADNLNSQVFAIPASTGSGKTTFTCGLIAALHEVDDEYTVAFITKTIQEAQSVYNNLSKLIGDDVRHMPASRSTQPVLLFGRHFKSSTAHFRRPVYADVNMNRLRCVTPCAYVLGSHRPDCGALHRPRRSVCQRGCDIPVVWSLS